MFKLARIALMLAVVQLSYAMGIVAICGAPWSLVLVAVYTGWRRITSGKFLWAHGNARFATAIELRKRGMLNGDKGLMVGRLGDKSRPSLIEAVGPLLNPRVEPKSACEQFLSIFGDKKGPLVRLPNAVHTAVFAPTGAGKGAGLIIPYLLSSSESMVCIDLKGELAKITAKHRRKRFGHRTVLLDPYRIVTKQPDTLNPLDFIDKDSPEAIDDCRDLAEQIVIKTGEEKDPHWNEAAEMWIGSAAAAIVQKGSPQFRSIQSVCDILSDPEKTQTLVKILRNADGMLPRLGGQLAHFQDKELASTLSSANRHLRSFSTPAIEQSTSSSSFDPAELRTGRCTVYLILPPEHLRAQMGLLRMWIGTLMRSVIRGGLQHG